MITYIFTIIKFPNLALSLAFRLSKNQFPINRWPLPSHTSQFHSLSYYTEKMTHLAFIWWPKTSPTTTDTAAADTAATCSMSMSPAKDAAMNSSSCGLSRLIRKLKRRSKMMLCTPGSRQPPAFQCRYDPLSYSLNFDAGRGRSLADEDDYYYKFCAFSSRFAAIPKNGCHQSRSLVLVAAWSLLLLL